MKKILIIEDDHSTAELVKILLLSKGYLMIHADNGSKTMKMAKEEKPDLILLDVMLPGEDGHSVQQKLLADPDTRRIPIILVTAQKQFEQVFTNAENVVGFIEKPFNIMELQKTIEAHLKE